ncbi:MAG TPA: DapH/DapD/GlmU-related protein [Gaiellaceae bacterium]|jgi:acetyltransferase-like isoleucine patch superfamily enzyme
MAEPLTNSSAIHLGPGAVIDDSVILGYASDRGGEMALSLGADARLRSGTVIYGGSSAGKRLQTGHNVIVREEVRLGDDVSIWSNTVVDYGCVIGDRVKIHSNCYVAQFTELEDDVFMAPGVTIANDLYPGSLDSGKAMAGPLIREGAQIGVNVTLLPYITVGRGAIIGAGSVVTRDVPDGMVAYGAPAVPVRPVPDAAYIESRVQPAREVRFSNVG